ncbi:putative glycosyltransferase [Vibrio virus VPMCC5]|nr:putative glycosyltransferase [Vibrio virus VPMCC5]
MVDSYSLLPDNLKVVLVTGLATIPLVLTIIESIFVDWVIKKARNEI